MRIRTRVYRLCRNKVKGPLFTVFIMCMTMYSMAIVRSVVETSTSTTRTRPPEEEQMPSLEELLDHGSDHVLLDDDVEGDDFSSESHDDSFLSAPSNHEARDAGETNHSHELNCSTHIMFLAESQLGNMMVKYSVLYGLRQKYNASVYLFPKQHRFAKRIFRNLSIPVIPSSLKSANWRPVDYKEIIYMLPCDPRSSVSEFFIITDWPENNGMPVYAEYVQELRNEFRFLPKISRRAEVFTSRHRPSPGSTLVGIHVRRGDHQLHTWLRHSRRLPDIQYFNRSMQYYNTMFPRTQFLVASDDRQFLQRSLLPALRPHRVIATEGLSEEQDMAVMSSCDHVIVTVGTFGLFSALLAGGSIASPAVRPGSGADPFDVQISPSYDPRQVFSWN